MDRRVWAGIIAGAAVVVLVIIGIVAYTNNGGSLASANNCGSSCSGCSAEKSGGCGGESYNAENEQASETTTDLKTLEKEAVNYYAKTYGDSNVTAKTFNAGCCTGVAIIKDGKIIDSLKYKDGQFFK
ncbi:MAG: hypothetical protein KBC24_06035 [Caldisericia bacterium]|nr:hypothetical protein [Caldisericia bacterium]NMD13939.1 hypothetical protein [Caldisericales bacterium]